MEANVMLGIWNSIPLETRALLVLVLFLAILSKSFPRNRRRKPRNKPEYREKPSRREIPACEAREKQKKPTLSREERLGQLGEDTVAQILCRTVPGEFQLFRNVYVPNANKNSQVKLLEADLLMAHEKGIFVFESKNYGGWIFGSIEDDYWTQVFPNRKKSFYSPVKQNANHIKSLSQYLNIPERDFYSYIVFSDDCELCKVPESSRSMVITQTADLEKQLRQRLDALSPCYGRGEIQRISERILPLTEVSAEAKAQHIEDIRNALESDVCPFCGGKLVLRRGRRGDFWGCSSYPKCKFKRAVER